MDQETTEPNISDVANQCSDLFTEYLACSASTQKDVTDELQSRFNLWAAYTGAFAPPGTSLDDRLIFDEDVKRMVLKLLYMVQRNIQSALRIDRNHDDHMIPSNPEAPVNSSEFLGLEAVPAALDRLHRLATAIRRSSVESQKDKLLTKVWKSEEDSYFGNCIYHFLQDRFPSARESLLKQLTAALCFHRKRLLYQPRHNRKLRQNERQRKKDQLRLLSRMVQSRQPKESDLSLSAAAHGFPPMVAMSTTDASIPNSQLRRALMQFPKPALSVASTGSSVQGEAFHYPDPPSFAKEERFHPCPYCSEPLPTSKLDMEKKININFWRDHVSQDLEPYFCISEECREPLQFFVHFQDWLEHMNTSHTVEWYRSVHMLTWFCDIGHNQRQLFSDKANFEAHTRASHGNLTASQLIARTKRSKNVASREPFTCPLCDCVPQKLAAIYPQQRLEEVSGLLGKHVAFHIKALSLLSFRLLPCEDDGEGIHENALNLLGDMSMDIQRELSGSEQRMELSSDAELSESFEDIPVTDRDTNEAISIEDMIVHATSELADPELWTFLPAFDYLSSSNRLRPPSNDPLSGNVENPSETTPHQASTEMELFPVKPDTSMPSPPSAQDVAIMDVDQQPQRRLLPPVPDHLKGRKCLVLDLDETLVHRSLKILHQADFTVPVEIEGQYHNVYVLKRPGLFQFMKRVGELFEVVVFADAPARDVDPVIDQIDIYRVVHHRLFRESCYRHNGMYVKDLSQLGRDLKSTIIMDNSPTSYLFHPQHALSISSWFSDAHDNELLDLIPVLEDLAEAKVRDVSLMLDRAN